MIGMASGIVRGAAGYLLAALLGAALCGYGVYLVQELRLDAAMLRAESAERREQVAKFDLAACQTATERQNAAIRETEERARAAQQAMEQANAERDQAEDRATQILRERTPENVDSCVAARDAFAAELRRERAQ